MKAWIWILWIAALSSVCPGLVHAYQPGDHELLLMPTAFTMEQGQGYFSAYSKPK